MNAVIIAMLHTGEAACAAARSYSVAQVIDQYASLRDRIVVLVEVRQGHPARAWLARNSV